MSRLKLTLLDNCYSFVREALIKAIDAEKDKQQWKFAILFIVQAIELLLKERLRLEHYVLIFKDVDNRNITVSIKEASQRLKDLVKIQMTSDENSSLKTAIRWRNQIVHYEFDFTVAESKSVFAKLLGFIQSFHDIHLKKPLNGIIGDSLWEEAISVKAFADELYERAKQKLDAEKIDPLLVWVCNRCGWETFVIQDNIDKCYLCGHEEEVISCKDCSEPIYRVDAKENEYGNWKGMNFKELLCETCYRLKTDEEGWRYSNEDE